MVREIVTVENKYDKTGKAYRVFCGKSTDEKPTENLITGSVFVEVDTKKKYYYDEEEEDWV